MLSALQGTVQLVIELIFEPGSIVFDRICTELPIASNEPFTPLQDYSGESNALQITAAFQVTCDSQRGFYGENCDTFCRARDDEDGHFTCDNATGRMVCLRGYRDVRSNCTRCATSDGCCKSAMKMFQCL